MAWITAYHRVGAAPRPLALNCCAMQRHSERETNFDIRRGLFLSPSSPRTPDQSAHTLPHAIS